MRSTERRYRSSDSTALLTVIVAVTVLYFARMVLIPLALAILLAFLLTPLVTRLRRLGLGRITAAAVVLFLALVVAVVVGGVVVGQMGELAQKLPEYQSNVRKKLDSIKQSVIIKKATTAVRSLNRELAPAPDKDAVSANEEKPVPVQIHQDTISPMDAVQKVLGPVIELSLMATIVIVFVIFMLIQREDLRNRIIRLAGETRINVTTQLLDDAARRVSRYLLAQLGLNVAFGVMAGIGLYFFGVPNPMLWAILAALLRYVPYLGIWIAAVLPAALIFAVDPGWLKVVGIFGLYFGIDVLAINFAEPLVYGSSTGVSPIAILVAAVFWTWLWGPVGLLLATPLTVCVVVLGSHVPRLHFLSVMLSDEGVLSPEARLYQRLLAMDLGEATEVVEECLKGKKLEDLYDGVMIPAMQLAEEERHRGLLDDERQKFIFQNMRLILEDVSQRAEELMNTKDSETPAEKTAVAPDRGIPRTDMTVVCLPARDEADALAAQMLTDLLTRRGIPAKALATGALASESLEAVEREGAGIACVSAIPPYGYIHARYLCQRLQKRFPNLKIVAAILTEKDVDEIRQRQPAIKADDLACSLKQALAGIVALVPVAEHSRQAEEAVAS